MACKFLYNGQWYEEAELKQIYESLTKPTSETAVSYSLKSINALLSDKAVALFTSLEKNKVRGDQFWNKVQQDLGIPKDQVELLKQYDTTDREQLIVNMVADYSYALEINTAKRDIVKEPFRMANEPYETDEQGFPIPGLTPTEYYANLTVPGGTNYTENEITTPGIVPAIKGHAQFATENGIGWFRSDEHRSDDNSGKKVPDGAGGLVQLGQVGSKTRRILEIQSDLFQKGRDKKLLEKTADVQEFKSSNGKVYKIIYDKKFGIASDESAFVLTNENNEPLRNSVSRQWIEKPPADVIEWVNTVKKSSGNQFLQLLNKENNWATFFTKSIIQDSVKKGYERILFPKGDTASKVEGHQTLEEFKRQKEDRIAFLKETIEPEVPSKKFIDSAMSVSTWGKTREQVTEELTRGIQERRKNTLNEIKTLESELKRIDREGFAALKPIYNFYENTVGNILKKQGYAPKTITDEYGNQWYEVDLSREVAKQPILLQTEEMPSSKASPETIKRIKEVLVKMGVSIQDLATYAKETGQNTKSVNGLADLVRGIIAIAEGKENVALTEEMVHIATAMIEQVNPRLVTEMISKIDRFRIYDETLKAYRDRKEYQLPNGKPDIRKIKKEAVDKLIAEVIVNGNEAIAQYPELMEENNQSLIRRWWNAILDWFRGTYRKANIDIFREVGEQIISGEFEGTVADLTGEGVFFQQATSEQQAVLDKINATKDLVHKRIGEKSKTDPMFMDTEEADNYYDVEQPDGTFEKVLKRVTDRVKAWYKQKFPGKVFTPEEKKFNEVKREFGIKGHSDFQEIHGRYFNEDGTRKSKPGPRPPKFNLPTQEMYDKLERYYVELIDSLGKDTLILSEVVLYDPKQKEAGTVDFLAIQKDGTAHILDWKFMFLKKNQSDIAFFKQGAYNIQLGRYKEMLRENYDVKKFGMIRAIPILMEFKPKDEKDLDKGWNLKGIVVGSANPDKIEDVRLLPLSEETETTGYEELDTVLRKLNKLLAMVGKQKVTDEEERELKYERQRILRRAIRVAQTQLDITPLIDVIEVMRKEGNRILDDYTASYKDRPASSTDSTNQELSDFSDDMNDYLATARVFIDIGRQIGDLIYEEGMDKKAKTEEEKKDVANRKDLLIKLNAESNAIFKSMEKIQKAKDEFADKHIGQRNLVFGLLKPERILKGLGSMFRGVSELPLRSLEILSKLTGVAQTKAAAAALEKVKSLMDIRERLAKRGGDLRKLVQTLYQKDTQGGLVNKLIYKYKDEFRKTVDTKAEAGGDMVWLRSNIDVAAYKKEAAELIDKQYKRIDKTNYPGTEEEVESRREFEKENVSRQWDIDDPEFNGWNNYIIKRHPLRKWLSEEYLNIEKDQDLLDLYNFISSFNQEAKDIGYINAEVMRTFLPFIRKGMAEQLVWDNTLSVMQNWKNTVQLKADDAGYGSYNELTGELENTIPKYYTYDFTFKDGVNDYSDVSEDLFKNLILYIQQVEKYKYLSEVEGQLKLVKTIEEFKNHLNTNKQGEVVMKDGKPEEITGNEENSKMFDDFLRVLLYDQKYVLSDVDLPLNIGKVLNFVKRSINKVAGTEVFKPDEDATPSSLIKTIDAANRAFQIKTLGFEFISGAVNAFGGNIQLATQAGNYFKAREFLANETKLINQSFNSPEEKEMFMQLVETFMPLKDDPSYEIMKKAGMSPLTRGSMTDTLMWFMRFPEQVIEKSIFVTLLQNTMVVDGKIVNIREYVKGKYKNRYDSAAKYKQVKGSIDTEIEELKRTKSMWVTKELKNGKLEIPGLDLSNKTELQRLTNLTKNISSNVTGNLTKQNINRMSMNIWTKSMMLFKNWIPKLADTRFGEFRRITDDFSVRVDEEGNVIGQKYDIGRIRLLGDVLLRDNIFKGIANINNIMSMNDEGLALMDAMFEEYREKYERETGEKLNMTREDFIDLIRTNLRNQVKELAILASLLGAMLALGFMAPDDDKDKAAKNRHRYYQKTIDKFVSELSFFYNPAEMEQTLSGGIFPAIGIANDFSKFTNHLFKETTGWDLDPKTSTEDVRKKAQPVKYAMKMAPITKSLVTYLSILDADFAKEYKVTIQKENNR